MQIIPWPAGIEVIHELNELLQLLAASQKMSSPLSDVTKTLYIHLDLHLNLLELLLSIRETKQFA
jgi:hypothetical protein